MQIADPGSETTWAQELASGVGAADGDILVMHEGTAAALLEHLDELEGLRRYRRVLHWLAPRVLLLEIDGGPDRVHHWVAEERDPAAELLEDVERLMRRGSALAWREALSGDGHASRSAPEQLLANGEAIEKARNKGYDRGRCHARRELADVLELDDSLSWGNLLAAVATPEHVERGNRHVRALNWLAAGESCADRTVHPVNGTYLVSWRSKDGTRHSQFEDTFLAAAERGMRGTGDLDQDRPVSDNTDNAPHYHGVMRWPEQDNAPEEEEPDSDLQVGRMAQRVEMANDVCYAFGIPAGLDAPGWSDLLARIRKDQDELAELDELRRYQRALNWLTTEGMAFSFENNSTDDHTFDIVVWTDDGRRLESAGPTPLLALEAGRAAAGEKEPPSDNIRYVKQEAERSPNRADLDVCQMSNMGGAWACHECGREPDAELRAHLDAGFIPRGYKARACPGPERAADAITGDSQLGAVPVACPDCGQAPGCSCPPEVISARVFAARIAPVPEYVGCNYCGSTFPAGGGHVCPVDDEADATWAEARDLLAAALGVPSELVGFDELLLRVSELRSSPSLDAKDGADLYRSGFRDALTTLERKRADAGESENLEQNQGVTPARQVERPPGSAALPYRILCQTEHPEPRPWDGIAPPVRITGWCSDCGAVRGSMPELWYSPRPAPRPPPVDPPAGWLIDPLGGLFREDGRGQHVWVDAGQLHSVPGNGSAPVDVVAWVLAKASPFRGCVVIGRPERPRRTFELDLHVDGDSWKDVLRELLYLAHHIEEHGPECTSVGGGYSTGHRVKVRHDPEMTGDLFREHLAVYLARLDALGENEGKS